MIRERREFLAMFRIGALILSARSVFAIGLLLESIVLAQRCRRCLFALCANIFTVECVFLFVVCGYSDRYVGEPRGVNTNNTSRCESNETLGIVRTEKRQLSNLVSVIFFRPFASGTIDHNGKIRNAVTTRQCWRHKRHIARTLTCFVFETHSDRKSTKSNTLITNIFAHRPLSV